MYAQLVDRLDLVGDGGVVRGVRCEGVMYAQLAGRLDLVGEGKRVGGTHSSCR